MQVDPALPVYYKGVKVGQYNAELIIEGKVAVSIRTGRNLQELDEQQLHNTLRASGCAVGMLLVFGPKPRFRRLLAWTASRRIGALGDAVASDSDDTPLNGGEQ
jgi:GxxExxY protein